MKPGKHQRSRQRWRDLCWQVHDRARSFVLRCTLCMSHVINTFLLVSSSVSSKHLISTSLHVQMQSINFILVSFGLAQAANMNHIHAKHGLLQQLIVYRKTIPCDTAGYEKPKKPHGEKTGNVFPEPMQCHDPSGVQRASCYKIIMIYKRNKRYTD